MREEQRGRDNAMKKRKREREKNREGEARARKKEKKRGTRCRIRKKENDRGQNPQSLFLPSSRKKKERNKRPASSFRRKPSPVNMPRTSCSLVLGALLLCATAAQVSESGRRKNSSPTGIESSAVRSIGPSNLFRVFSPRLRRHRFISVGQRDQHASG